MLLKCWVLIQILQPPAEQRHLPMIESGQLLKSLKVQTDTLTLRKYKLHLTTAMMTV